MLKLSQHEKRVEEVVSAKTCTPTLRKPSVSLPRPVGLGHIAADIRLRFATPKSFALGTTSYVRNH